MPEPSDGTTVELIWGYWHVSPAPGAPHQHACSRIWRALEDAVEESGRRDLFAVQAVGVDISTAMRYGLIPDVAILNQPLTDITYPPSALQLAVEVWSPGNNKRERETKVSGYAAAGVPFLWTVEVKRAWSLDIRGFVLDSGTYRQAAASTKADMWLQLPAPIPVTLDVTRLLPPQ